MSETRWAAVGHTLGARDCDRDARQFHRVPTPVVDEDVLMLDYQRLLLDHLDWPDGWPAWGEFRDGYSAGYYHRLDLLQQASFPTDLVPVYERQGNE